MIDAASNALAINPQSLDSLRMLAKQGNSKEAARTGAQQFEAYFLQMVLKSMRASMTEDGPFDSQEMRMFTDMFDQQLALNIARSKGVGLADMLTEQLTRMNGPNAAANEPLPHRILPTFTAPPPVISQPVPSSIKSSSSMGQFVDQLWTHAASAGKAIGVAPHLLLGQAALESGWGKQVLRLPDGSSSHNLFNIKAGAGWKGDVVQTQTTEYVNGVAQKSMETFRVYASEKEAFADYARLLASNSRYSGAVGKGTDSAGFARGLQNGGFATDPMYADKLLRVLNSSVFRTALQPAQVSEYLG